MDFGILIRLLNIFLAIVSIPPSLYILHTLIKEKKVVDTKQKDLNRLLVYLFAGVVVGAVLNAYISILAVTGYKGYASNFSIYRSVYVSFFFSSVTWAIYFFQRSIRKKSK